jgi:hypothetical protein
MLLRTPRYRPLLVAAVILCGCGPQVSYNESTDPAKDAVAIGGGTPPQRSEKAAKKIKKPPGPAAKDFKGTRPVD